MKVFSLKSFLQYDICSKLAHSTYPNSAMPSTNSFLENSHCVAALNFHASIKTVRLVGSRLASSQNRLTPSANILSSSTESVKKTQKKYNIQRFVCYGS